MVVHPLQITHFGALDWRFPDVLRMVRLLLPGTQPFLRLPVLAIVRVSDHGRGLCRHFRPRLLIDQYIRPPAAISKRFPTLPHCKALRTIIKSEISSDPPPIFNRVTE